MTQINANGPFNYLESELQVEPFQVKLVMCDADKHALRPQNGIREVKDRIWCKQMIMGYKRVPSRLVI